MEVMACESDNSGVRYIDFASPVNNIQVNSVCVRMQLPQARTISAVTAYYHIFKPEGVVNKSPSLSSSVDL